MTFRKATLEDIPAIVAMIANDKLGKTREDFQIPLPTQIVGFLNLFLFDPF